MWWTSVDDIAGRPALTRTVVLLVRPPSPPFPREEFLIGTLGGDRKLLLLLIARQQYMFYVMLHIMESRTGGGSGGAKRALRIVIEGRPFNPAEALDLGLVDQVVASSELRQVAIAEATRLGRRPKAAMAQALSRGRFDAGTPR